jgi:hypothetical protein
MAALAGPALAADGPAGATGAPIRRAVAGPVDRQVEGEGPQIPVRPETDDERTRQRADEILARDEYQAPEPRGKTIGERIREWLDDRLPSFGGGPGLDGAAWVVTAVVGVGALAALVWFLTTTARRRRPPEDDEETDASIEVAPLRTPAEWAEEAARCTAAGDHRGAVRAHFRVLTSTLADRKLVADTPGRTVGELRHDVVDRVPKAGPTFDASATLFEEVWFGDRPAGPPETERAASLTRETLDAAPRRGRGEGPDDDGDGPDGAAGPEQGDEVASRSTGGGDPT